jgi:YVTN family beta-propeller protein
VKLSVKSFVDSYITVWGSHDAVKGMKHGTTKTLRVGCILLAIFFLICAFALLPQPVQATNTVTVTVGSNPMGVAVTPNGAYAYVTNAGSGTVSVISTATNTVTATVPVGNNPGGVAITPNGAHTYVANNGSDSVSVISTATKTLFSVVDWSILIIVIIIVLFLIVLAWYRRGKKKTQQTQTT